jgi:hypothetical protein
VQGVLALAFIIAGSMKVFAYENHKVMSEKNGPMDLKRGPGDVPALPGSYRPIRK